MIKAILFDFDGLILDTETPIFTAWQQIYAEFACSLSLAEYSSCVGAADSHFDPLADLSAKCATPLAADEIRPRVAKLYRSEIARQETLPGIREALAAAENLKLRTALVSNSTRTWVGEHLERLGLLPHFEIIRTRDDVSRPKPEPDLYLAALEALEIAPGEAVAFEDSPHGILAARRAGVYAVAIPNQMTRALPLNDPDLELASLAEMPLPKLIEQIRQERGRI